MKMIRTQWDDLGDKYSSETGLSCDPDENMTRQEFGADTEVDVVLQRFGAIPNYGRVPQYGAEIDYSADLAVALERVELAQQAYRELSPALRQRYPDPLSLYEALVSGELSIKAAQERPDVPSGGPGQPPAGAPSADPAPKPAD